MNRIMNRCVQLALCCALSAGAWAQKHSEHARLEYERRKALIAAELQASAVGWSGEYAYGDGLGVNVDFSVAPNSGFIFTWHGCLGLYDLNYGSVDARLDRIVIDPLLPNAPGRLAALPNVLIPVQWGERRYLIGSDQFKDFANAVNSGSERCEEMCSAFLRRVGGDTVQVSGRPAVPREYTHLLLERPIEAQVLKVLGSTIEREEEVKITWRVTTVQLDVGRENGVWEGMHFHRGEHRFWEAFAITQVGVRTSVAIIREMSPDGEGPQPGLALSTRAVETNNRVKVTAPALSLTPAV